MFYKAACYMEMDLIMLVSGLLNGLIFTCLCVMKWPEEVPIEHYLWILLF